MSRRQLILFSLGSLIGFGNGTGLSTVLPVYLNQFGMDTGSIGLLFSVLFLAIAASGIIAGWLADRFQRRKLLANLCTAGLVFAALALVLARSLPVLIAALVLNWFLGGAGLMMNGILVGMHARDGERGQVFGILALMGTLGSALSGFTYGWIIDQAGFSALFALTVALSAVWFVLTLFYRDVPNLQRAALAQVESPRSPALGGLFILVLCAATLSMITVNGGKLGISIVMNQLHFSNNDISLSNGISSLIALPSGLIAGWLSDRIGRKRVLIALHLLGILALLTLAFGRSLVSFWVGSSLLSLFAAFGVLMNAMTTDLVPRQSLGLGLSLMNMTNFASGIISSSLLGLSLAALGVTSTYLIALILPLSAAAMLAFLPKTHPQSAVDTSPA